MVGLLILMNYNRWAMLIFSLQPQTLDSSRHQRRKLPAPPLKGTKRANFAHLGEIYYVETKKNVFMHFFFFLNWTKLRTYAGYSLVYTKCERVCLCTRVKPRHLEMGTETEGRDIFIRPSHILCFVLKEERGHWMDVKVNTFAKKRLSNWKAPLDVKQPNGNTHTVQGDKAVLSTNCKSVPFHIREKPLSAAAFFIFFFVSLFFFTVIYTMTLIQGGFLAKLQRETAERTMGQTQWPRHWFSNSTLVCSFYQSIQRAPHL